MNASNRNSLTLRVGVVALAAGIALAGCAASSSKKSAAGAPSASSAGGGAAKTGTAGATQVLPVKANPITNSSTVQALKIDSVLVENNVDPATAKAADDHLEIALRNTGGAELSKFEAFYTFTDPTTKSSESYYTKLADSFTIPAGGTRVVHFDNTGAADHYPVNKFSLYATSKNALDVTVTVSAADAAVQTATIAKDAGGAENPGE